MIRVVKFTEGPRKGTFQRPSEIAGNIVAANLADAVTEQFEILTEGKDEAIIRKMLWRRKFATILLLALLVILTCRPRSALAQENKPRFDAIKYNTTEIWKLNNSNRQEAVKAITNDSDATLGHSLIIERLGPDMRNPVGFRQSIERRDRFKIFSRLVKKIELSKGVSMDGIDLAKMYIELEGQAVDYKIGILRSEEEVLANDHSVVIFRVFQPTVYTLYSTIAAALIGIFVCKLLTFFAEMKLKQARFIAKRFLAFENQRLKEFNLVAVEDLDLLSLCFVEKSLNPVHEAGTGFAQESLLTERASLTGHRYLFN